MKRSICLAETLVLALLLTSLGWGQKPRILTGHSNVISAVGYSNDGKQIVSASWDKTVRIWEADSGKLIRTLEGHRDWVLGAKSTADAGVVSTSQNAYRSWTKSFDKPREVLGLGGPAVNTAAFSEDGKWLAIGRRDGMATLWSVGQQEPLQSLKGFSSWVSAVAVSTTTKKLVVGTRGGTVRVFDLKDLAKLKTDGGKELTKESGQQVMSLALHPDGSVLVVGRSAAKLWDLATAKEVATLSGHRGLVTAIAWSPDGKTLATGERHGSIFIWDYANGNKLLQKLTGHSDKQLGFTVTCLAFSKDGKSLVSGSYDKTVRVWNLGAEAGD